MSTAQASALRYDNDSEFLAEVLDCYKPHCRYLTSAVVDAPGDKIRGRATLAIPESCYIDDTGHLNAVEVSICFNQMLYHVIGTSVRHRIGDVFATWSMDDFRRRKLPDILIARFNSAFIRPMNPRAFHGEIVLNTVTQRRLHADSPPLVSLDTSFRYWDEAGGISKGRARVAIVVSDPAAPGGSPGAG